MSLAMGMVLGVLNVVVGTLVARWTLTQELRRAQAILLASFITRLTVMGTVLFGLSAAQVDILATAVALVVTLTLLLPFEVYVFAKRG